MDDNKRNRLQIAAEFSRATVSTLALDALLPQLAELIQERLECYWVGIFLVEGTGRAAVMRAGAGNAGGGPAAGFKQPLGGVGAVSQCVATGEVQTVFASGGGILAELPESRVEVAVPLQGRGRLLGALDIHYRQPGSVDDELRALLQILAGQIAVVIETDALQEKSRRAQDENQRLYRISRAVTEAASIQDVLGIIVDYLMPAQAERATLLLVLSNELGEPQALEVNGTRPVAGDYEPLHLRLAVDEFPLLLKLEKAPLFFSDVAQESELDEASRAMLARFSIGAVCIMPLRTGTRIFGMILISATEPMFFAPEDIRLLDNAADQLSISLENRRLLEQTQNALVESEMLYHAGTAFNNARSYRDVMDVVRAYTIVGQADLNVSLNLFDQPWVDEVPEWTIPVARWSKLDSGATDARYPLRAYPSASRLLHRTNPTLIPDVATDSQMDEMARMLYQKRYGAASTIFAPLVVGGQWIGYINAIYGVQTDFPEQEVRRLMTLVGQGAVALHGIWQQEQMRQRARQLEKLSEVQYALAQAHSEFEILAALAVALDSPETTRIRLSYLELNDAGEIEYLRPVLDWQGGNLIERGPDDKPLYAVSEVATVSLLLNRPEDVLWVDDVEKDPRIDEVGRKQAAELGFRSIAWIPLRTGGQWHGIISMTWTLPHPASGDEWFIYRRLLEPVAAVVASRRSAAAQLAAQKLVELRVRQLQTAAEVSRAASSILKLDELLSQSVELIAHRFGLYYVGIFLIEESGHWAVLRAATGEAGQKMLAANHKLEVGSQSMIGQCVARGEARIAMDVGMEKARVASPLLPDTRSEMALPLVARGQIIGAMTIQSVMAQAFAQEDIIVLQTMADQLANTIQNAGLFSQIQNTLKETEMLYQASAELNEARTYSEVLQAICMHSVLGKADLLVTLCIFDPPWESDMPPTWVLAKARWQSNLPDDLLSQRYALADYPSSDIVLGLINPLFLSETDGYQRLDANTQTLFLEHFGAHATLVVPLVVGGQRLGFIQGFFSEAIDFLESDSRTLIVLSHQAAVAVQALQRLEDVQLSETRFRDLALNTGDWLWELDAQGRFVYCSERVRDVLGYSSQEMLGRTMLDFVAPEESSRMRTFLEQMLSQPEAFVEREIRYRSRAGFEAVLLSSGLPILASDGALQGYRGVDRNITERKRADRTLREQINLLQSLLDGIPTPIFVKDTVGLYTVCNLAFENYMGRTRDQIIGRSAYDMASRDMADKYTEMDRILIDNPGVQVYESRVRYADGQYHDVIFNKATFNTLDGTLAGLVGVIFDISDRKAAEVEREQLLVDVQRRALQLQTASEISRASSSILNLDELLAQAVELIRDRFNLYYTGLFLVDDTGRWAVLRAGTGEAGRKMLAAGHKFEVGGTSMIGSCISQKQNRIALNVEAEAKRVANPLLPETRSEMALLLQHRDQVIGAMTIQSTRPDAFTEEDITVLGTMADQLANAIINARLFSEADRRLQELQSMQRQYAQETWGEYAQRQSLLGYDYDLTRITSLESNVWDSAELDSMLTGSEIRVEPRGEGAAVLAPLTLRGAPVGMLQLENPQETQTWVDEDLALINAVREQVSLALENRLLIEQTQQALAQTRVLYTIGQQMAEARTPDDVLQVAVNGISQHVHYDRIVGGLMEPAGMPIQFRIVTGQWRDGRQVEPTEIQLALWGELAERMARESYVIVPDVQRAAFVNAEVREYFNALGVQSVASFAMEVLNQPYAGVLIELQEFYEFSQAEIQFCENVVRQASVALENLNLLETSQAQAERRALLNEILQTASRSLETTTLMRDVGSVFASRLSLPTLLWVYDGEKIRLSAINLPEGMPVPVTEDWVCVPDEIPAISWAIRARETVMIRNLMNISPYSVMGQIRDAFGLQELFVMPLSARQRVLGVLLLGRPSTRAAIDETEGEFLRISMGNIGVALENARLYQESLETSERLKEMDRLKSEFLANMSHELRTPLNSIIGFSRVIIKGIDGPLTDMQRTDLQAIFDSGNHLLGLINDILDFSKIEAGKMELVFEATNLRDIIKGVMSTAIALVKDKQLDLKQEVPEDLPIVKADARRVRQVLLNLVGNSSKFTEKGHIKVFAFHDPMFVTIGVQDTGIGIPADKLDSVFEAFTQVDSSSTRRYGGTGLGLPVAKSFVEAHGGRMWVESVLGEGSIFYFTLPIEGPNAIKPKEETQKIEEKKKTGPLGRTILLADDDEGVVALYRKYLEKVGYVVVGLTSGEQVLEQARQVKPYAITLDVIMPGRDGWQLLQDLKADPETRDIPVVICSVVKDVGRGLSLGAADYLIKPVMEADLLESLSRVSRQVQPHVLVVDDNSDDRKLLRRVLEGAGYRVAEAPGGAEAIGRIHEDLPEVVVLDLMMPEVDGFAVLENIKTDDRTRDIPVVVVTAKELESAERERLEEHAESLLQKGNFSQEQLVKDVHSALERFMQKKEEEEAAANGEGPANPE